MFRWKLFAIYFSLLTLFIVIFYLWTEDWLDNFYRTTMQSQLESAAGLLTPWLNIDDPRLDAQVDAASAVPYRITIIDAEGRVRADSAFSGPALEGMENHLNRPEIQQTLAEGRGSSQRYSTSTEQEMLYVAGTLPDGRGFVRIAAPLSRIDEVAAGLRRSLGFSMLWLAVVGLLLTIRVSYRQTRSVAALCQAAQQMAAGNFDIHVPAASGEPVGLLGQHIKEMADRLKSRFQQAEVHRGRLVSILHGVSEGVMLVDSRGRIRAVNTAFKEIFACDSDPVGKMQLEAVRSFELQAGVRHALRQRRPHRIEMQFQHRTLVVNFSIVPIDAGEEGVAAIFTDVTEVRRLTSVRKDFFSNVSHELKTPLTNIRGYAETLADDDRLSAQQRQFAAKIHRNADQLRETVDALLELTRLEGSEPRAAPEALEFRPFMQTLLGNYSERLKAKGLQLTVLNRSGLQSFPVNETYLKRALSNLIENSLKYTERGRINIEVESDDQGLVFTVSDTGKGIPRKDQERVFERFYRVAEARSQVSGSGVGLSIVRQIVQMQGGRVWLESEPGKGTAVHFTWPLKSPQTSTGGDA